MDNKEEKMKKYRLLIIDNLEGRECPDCMIGDFKNEDELKRWAVENNGELEKVEKEN